PILLEREIRQQQVVIDDDDVRLERLAARERYVAAGNLRATHAKATLARGGDLTPHRMSVRQTAHLREITALRGARPALDARQHAVRGARARHGARHQCELLGRLLGALEAIAAQIIAT